MTRRAALIAVLAAVAAVLVSAPDPIGWPARRLAHYRGHGPDPHYSAPVDGAAVRRAGALLPDHGTYFVWAPYAEPLLQGNLKAATELFLSPALPVQAPRDAQWVLSYYAGNRMPSGVRAVSRTVLAPGIALVRVRTS